MNSKYLAILNILGLIAVLIVNALANILPINGMNTGEISALYPSLFTPAGITFSIWSIIYLLLTGFVIVQWRILNKSFFVELSLWFLLSCLANACWIIVWHYMYTGASVAIMLILLVSLTNIFLLLHKVDLTFLEKSLVKLPFTLYFSWIGVATIANVSALLVSLQWNGAPLTETAWTLIMIGIAVALSVFITVRFSAPAYTLVTLWAMVGIYLRWHESEHTLISGAAQLSAAILITTFLAVLIRNNSYRKNLVR